MEYYVRDCCNHAAEAKEIVRGVHKQKEAVVRQCRLLSGLQLARIDRNVVYDGREFGKQQGEHCINIRAKVCVQPKGVLCGERGAVARRVVSCYLFEYFHYAG